VEVGDALDKADFCLSLRDVDVQLRLRRKGVGECALQRLLDLSSNGPIVMAWPEANGRTSCWDTLAARPKMYLLATRAACSL
jgi:hypothetical protein